MDRGSRRRIEKIEELLSAAKKERDEKRKKEFENFLLHARFHATAVAAIVLSGAPKIDEPLIRAWTRALQHYGISALQRYGVNLDEEARTKNQVAAAQHLFAIIVGGAEESAKFTEIFRTAPGWLLDFTRTFIDASFLNFHLPRKSERSKWGSAGRDASWRWPLLPLGMMTDGDPVSDEEAQLWPIQLRMKEQVDLVPSFDDNCSQEDEGSPSPEADLLEDMKLCRDVADNPGREKELSRYERLRLLKLFERLAAGDN